MKLIVFTNVYLRPEHEHKGSTWAARIQKQIFVLAADEKKIVNPVIFNLLSEALLGQECIGKKGYACMPHRLSTHFSCNSISSCLGKSELLCWWFFRSGLKGSEGFRGLKISRFVQLKGFWSQLNKSNQQAWGSFHSRRWECRAGLRSVSLNTHNGFILLVQTSKLIVWSDRSLV